MRRPARGRLGRWSAGLAGPAGRVGLCALLLAALFLLSGCNRYQDHYRNRQMQAAKGKGPVKIAVVTSSNLPNLTPQGAELAAKLVNERGGVLGGRKLELLHYDDEGKLPVGERLARRLASNTDVVAVIGHIYSEVAIPCSIIYGTAGLLFMSTGATDPDLTLIPNPFSFRNVPRDDAIAREMANLCKKLGQQRLVVLFERGLFSSFYGLSLAQNFSSAAVDVGLDVMHVRSYFSWQEDVRRVILQLRQSGFDAMLLVGYLPQAGHIIHQARGLGIKCCIIGPDSLDNQDLLRHAKDAADGVITTNFFRPDLDRPQTREFVAAFKKAHGKMPDSDAAASFDAVNLLVAAMKDCGSSIPLEMAQALNYMNMMPGVCSDYTFNEDGDVVGRQMWFREVIHNRFEYLPEEYQPRSTGALTR
ncbi:MAG: ABC transporter substrate-binding protein [Pseudomonadota bacterium]